MSDSRQEPQISRRALLKVILAASGSLAASAMLPGKWVKPAMRVGVLPVHAQTSRPQTYQIVDTSCDYLPGDGCLSNMMVTISPADDGIPMKVTICDVSGASAQCVTSKDLPTTAGVANFGDYPTCFGSTTITITFGFANTSQCTANCLVQYRFPELT